MAGYGDEEQSLIRSCVTQAQKDSIESIKPKLNGNQYILLSAFYRLSQERGLEQGSPLPIKDKAIYLYLSKNGSGTTPEDLFIMAIHEVDEEYIKQYCDEIKRKNKGL